VPEFSGIVPAGVRDTRLDRYVAEQLRLLTRSQVKQRNLSARVNGKPAKVSRIVKDGDALSLSWDVAPSSELLPENLPLDIIYEDERVIVINKAQSMVVHPGAGNRTGTVANAILYRRLFRTALSASSGAIGMPSRGAGEGARPELSLPGVAADRGTWLESYVAGASSASFPNFRPGIVHRLDKDTSGVLIAAYDDEALVFLADQFKNRKTRKLYAAIVKGIPKAGEGLIETFIARDPHDRKRFTVCADRGKAAITRYKVIRSWGDCSLLLLRPKTGRTHQLRVHMRHIGCPIIGDPIYGVADPRRPLMLHAKSLSITLPGREEASVFKAPLPERFFYIGSL
jgi:23S rRNA pseudouridine1911/1915/1917 synthase